MSATESIDRTVAEFVRNKGEVRAKSIPHFMSMLPRCSGMTCRSLRESLRRQRNNGRLVLKRIDGTNMTLVRPGPKL